MEREEGCRHRRRILCPSDVCITHLETPQFPSNLLNSPDSFDIENVPYEPAPAPAPGPALLDDSESHMLENFFNTMGSSHLDNNDILFGQQHTGGTHDLNFDWNEELPPIFVDSRTTLPQSLRLPHNMPLGDDGLLNLSHSHDAAATSPEILAAASMLYQNGQINGHEMGHTYQNQPFFGDIHGNQNTSNSHHPSLGMGNGVPSHMASLPRKAPYGSGNGEMLQNMFYGAPPQNPPDHGLQHKGDGLRWGSDASFIGPGFMAPPTQETEEEVTKNVLQSLECLEPQSSANNTRPTSPTALRQEPVMVTKGQNVRASAKKENIDRSAAITDEARPRKKVKTKPNGEDDESDDYGASSTKPKKGKATAKNRRSSSTAESPMKRRKSHGANSKGTRENLTEEQKRSNHILSEQKRRNLIKQGFEDLCDLVPELQGGGFSKSAMLIQAADYLEDVLRGNDALKAQLSDLKAGKGMGGYG
jgi:hypothetical protein